MVEIIDLADDTDGDDEDADSGWGDPSLVTCHRSIVPGSRAVEGAPCMGVGCAMWDSDERRCWDVIQAESIAVYHQAMLEAFERYGQSGGQSGG